MAIPKTLTVCGYVEGLFQKSDVQTMGGMMAVPGYRCRNCEKLFLADSPEKVPPHECTPAVVL